MTRKNSRAKVVLGAALIIAPIMTIGGLAASSVAGAASTTRLLTCTGKFASKPSTYVLSCADYGAGWTHITWSTWTSTSAVGHGFLRQNNCTPNCAAGKFIDYPGTVTLSQVLATKKYGELYSRAVFHYRENGKAKTEVFGLAD